MATCVVSGTLLDPSEAAIEGATISFNVDQPVFNASFSLIGPDEISTTTAADGTWSLTISQQASGTITMSIPPNISSSVVRYTFGVIIPAASTATFAAVWVNPTNVLVPSTFPITFAIIGGILASNQLPTLSSGQIWVGNGSNLATAITPSGEATISNAGVVTLSNGAVIAKVLTGYTSGAGTVLATDTILQAIQKLNGNQAATANAATSVGALDAQAANASGASLVSSVLSLQSADATHPGLVTSGIQTIGGAKTFSGAITASNLSGTNSGDITLAAVGSSPSSSGASLSGQALTLQPADSSNPGLVSTTAQTFAGAKTFSGQIVSSVSTGTAPFSVASTTQVANLNAATAGTATTATSATTATTATNATNIATTATTTNASFYPTFVASSSNGNQAQQLDTGLTYNPSTHALTTTTFVGALTGTASGNATLTPNNHGMIVSGSGNTLTVIAPDASTTKVWTSGGSSANPGWQTPAIANLSVTSVSSTYSVTTSDQLVIATSGTFTMTLPTAVGVTGKEYILKNTGTGIITIATTSSQTMDGITTRKLASQNEAYRLASDGANWVVTEHQIPCVTSTYTPTFTGIGTPSNVNAFWTRTGNRLSVWGNATTGTVTGTTFSITLPNSVAIDSTAYNSSKTQNVPGSLVNTTTGSAVFPTVGAGPWPVLVDVNTSTALIYAGNTAGGNDFSKFAGNGPFANSQNFNFSFEVIISGWNQ